MSLTKWALLLALAVVTLAGEAPLPALRIEPVTGGSVFYVKNTGSPPLTAYLIELVGYPGSEYSLWQDHDGSDLIAPGAEQRIPINNMTVGAVPEYVKMQAALYADGSSSGIPEKVQQLVERRRFLLETVRELIHRLEKAKSDGLDKAAVIAALRQWSDSLQPQGRARMSAQAINQAAGRSRIVETIAALNPHSLDEVLANLRGAEHSLAASKPAL